MFKALAYAICALVFGLLLAGAAVAETKKPPGEKGSKERFEFCGDQAATCGVQCQTDFGDLPNVFLPTCNEACDDDYRACLDAARRAVLRNNIFDILQSPGVLNESDIHNYHTVPVGGLGAADVEQACKRVNGVFGRTKNGFGCINAKCDDKGNCTIVCYGGNCLAITPDVLPDGLTLIGILQNGNPVVKGGSAGGGLSTPGSEGKPCDDKKCL